MISAPSTAPHILRYLAIVKVAQRAGLSLDEVLDALGQYQPGVHLTAAHWRRVASRWREDLDDRITQLMRLRDELGGCIGCGCLSLSKSARCVIRATYSRARGPVRVSLSENRRDL
ncbi:TPA: MerR family DNA-binding protein [Pseudomonas aeruginosa]